MMLKCGYEKVKGQIDQHPMWNNTIPSFCFAIKRKTNTTLVDRTKQPQVFTQNL